MNLEEILRIIASALAGGLVTSLCFVFGQSNKIAKMDEKLDRLAEDLKEHLRQPSQPCNYHNQHVEKLVTMCTEQKDILRRMETFEESTSGRIDRLEAKL